MKTITIIITILIAGCICSQPASSQILKKKKVNEKVKSIGKGLGGLLKKDKKETKVDTVIIKVEEQKQPADIKADEPSKPTLNWAKFDFIPGDKIIFEDNLLNEENGEFPSRWDLVRGNVENASLDGENVIMFRGNAPTIIPYLKNSNIDYLPEVFTIEFDLLLPSNTFIVYLYDRKNQEALSSAQLTIRPNKMEFGPAGSNLPDGASIAERWAHISIAYTSGKLKAYIDETRLVNIPRLSFDPTGITLYAYSASDDNTYFVKNIRIAEGGVKYYDRFLQDGKIVSNGIRFDTGKSTLRPESMGVLNEILKMLTDHPEINISIEGHTDNVGDDALNQKLSEERALAVMNQIINMGISADRLSFKGFGESNPVSPNDTPERKAENRRVEFVKM